MIAHKLILAAALAGLTTALEVGLPAPWNTCCNLTDPGQVLLATRSGWCQAQQNTCISLCGGPGGVNENSCDDTELTYTCTCFQGNPGNISNYAQSLDAQECQEWANECTLAFPTNATAQFVCQHVNCGTANASDADAASSSSSSSTSPSSTSASQSSSTSGSGTAAQTTSSAAPSSSGAAVPVGISREASTGLAGAILFGIFSFFL